MARPNTVPTKLQQEQTRAAIQTSQLVNRLQAHALGKKIPHDRGKEPPAELDALRIKAIEILLRKTLPDLANIQLSGDEDNPLALVATIRLAGRDD
jgi:hypothetical protein